MEGFHLDVTLYDVFYGKVTMEKKTTPLGDIKAS